MPFAVLVVSHLGYEGGIWLASVPGHCLPFTCVILNWHFFCVFCNTNPNSAFTERIVVKNITA